MYLGARGPFDEKYERIKQNWKKDVLVHCRHGADRTGAVLGRYRIEKGEIDKTEALSEALSMGFKPEHILGMKRSRSKSTPQSLDARRGNRSFSCPICGYIMKANANGSKSSAMGDNPGLWDKRFYEHVADASYRIAGQSKSWKRLEKAKDDYINVLNELREHNLPDVFAAIPLQETRYIKGLSSPTCAGGIWQLKPETAQNLGLKVENCSVKGKSKKWTPTEAAAPLPHQAQYVAINNNQYQCKIKNNGKCDRDERFNVNKSTKAMMTLLSEVYWNTSVQTSGSAVQIALLANNHGFSIDKDGNARPSIITAYTKFRDSNPNGHQFYGDNITCSKAIDAHSPNSYHETCGGQLGVQTQRYGYEVVARHFTAVLLH